MTLRAANGLGVLFIILGILVGLTSVEAKSKELRYVITETSISNSVDPIDADQARNLPVARMIFATPLEVTKDSRLSSRVLKNFRYDSESRTIHWELREGVRFSDETPITADDVVLAILRVAYARPTFPVLEHIEGIESWAKKKDALRSVPSGIHVLKNSISIRLKKHVEHPLFRFCLELFSIVPRRCVDLSTNRVSCETLPSSGYYIIVERNLSEILFRRTDATAVEEAGLPEAIRFEYISPTDLLAKKVSNQYAVITGSDRSFTPKELKTIEDTYTVRHFPTARFSALLLNPTTQIFKDELCRRTFAEVFRDAYREVCGSDQRPEASIFTKLLPGYLSQTELQESLKAKVKEADLQKCKKMLSESRIPWGHTRLQSESLGTKAFRLTMEKLGNMVSPPIVFVDEDQMEAQFLGGQSATMLHGSGFWALDPESDVKMLFTPGLHAHLKFVSEDKTAQSLISKLNDGKAAHVEFNRYLFKAAVHNSYSHNKRFFASVNPDIFNSVGFAITAPAPWQVFKVDK